MQIKNKNLRYRKSILVPLNDYSRKHEWLCKHISVIMYNHGYVALIQKEKKRKEAIT